MVEYLYFDGRNRRDPGDSDTTLPRIRSYCWETSPKRDYLEGFKLHKGGMACVYGILPGSRRFLSSK